MEPFCFSLPLSFFCFVKSLHCSFLVSFLPVHSHPFFPRSSLFSVNCFSLPIAILSFHFFARPRRRTSISLQPSPTACAQDASTLRSSGTPRRTGEMGGIRILHAAARTCKWMQVERQRQGGVVCKVLAACHPLHALPRASSAQEPELNALWCIASTKEDILCFLKTDFGCPFVPQTNLRGSNLPSFSDSDNAPGRAK